LSRKFKDRDAGVGQWLAGLLGRNVPGRYYFARSRVCIQPGDLDIAPEKPTGRGRERFSGDYETNAPIHWLVGGEFWLREYLSRV
jgi:hypothetical protein